MLLSAVVLGVIGNAATFPHDSAAATAYRTLQLFAIEGEPTEDGSPALVAARFLAPVGLALTAVMAFVALARMEVLGLLARIVPNRRLLVVGMGPVAAVTTRRAGRGPLSVVVLCDDDRRAVVDRYARRWWPVVTGDVTDRRVLRTLRLDRADHVVIASGDDSTNLRALGSCLAVAAPAGRRGPHFHVEVADPCLWREAAARALVDERDRPLVEIFNPDDRLTRVLLGRLREGRPAAPSPIAVRAPDGPLEHLLVQLRAADPAARVVLTGPDAETQRQRLSARLPWAAALLAPGETPPRSAVVCGLPDAEGIAAAAELARELPGVRVRLAVSDEALVDALPETPLAAADIELVPAEPLAFGPALLDGSVIETLAEARHELYRQLQAQRGDTLAENPSLLQWAELPASLKDSNRAFARDVAPKLARMGFELVPLAAGDERPPTLTPEEVERLAEEEHERWVRDLVEQGWKPHRGPKDPERRRHPLLVPWRELPEEEREKDRDAIRALPRFIALLGYGLRRA